MHLPRPITASSGPRASGRAGFTIVEMLVVVAIIIVLLSVLLLALNLATRSAQRASTTFLMSSIAKGLASFKVEFGYFPPVQGQRAIDGSFVPGGERTAVNSPDPALGAAFNTSLQNWYSETTLPEYLLGIGDRTEDGYGVVGDFDAASSAFPGSPGLKEIPTLGFRDPGSDGVWGSWSDPRVLASGNVRPADGSVASRKLTPFLPSPPAPTPSLAANNDLLPGRVYGPYLDLKDDRLVGRLRTDGTVALPGEPGYDLARPAAILDYWGRPLRYYRRPHQPFDLRTAGDRGTLADMIALRPWSFAPGEEILGIPDANTAVSSPLPGGASVPGDNATSQRLLTADFAIFSEGPDRRSNRFRRIDAEEFNKDNIVEVGR